MGSPGAAKAANYRLGLWELSSHCSPHQAVPEALPQPVELCPTQAQQNFHLPLCLECPDPGREKWRRWAHQSQSIRRCSWNWKNIEDLCAISISSSSWTSICLGAVILVSCVSMIGSWVFSRQPHSVVGNPHYCSHEELTWFKMGAGRVACF